MYSRTRSVPILLFAALLTSANLSPVVAAPSAAAATDPCGSEGNPITCENSKTGTDPSVWDIDGAGDPSIQGFATDISANVGTRIDFKIDTDAARYSIDIYRTGWYQGLGARKIASTTPSTTLPQSQPQCITDIQTELYDCGTWAVSASWDVPEDAVSGVYVALLTRADTGGKSHITFVVRDVSSQSDILFQTSDPTWHAYNTWGGSDFYQGGTHGRAFKVSYNRPFADRGGDTWRSFYFSSEYATVRFLEKNGYDVSYFSGVDTDRFGSALLNHRVFLSVGHDEYWSGAQRANVEAARDAGVNLQFLSGNEGYWRTRYEPSTDARATEYRTLVSYKETLSYGKIDPSEEWTGTWRDPRYTTQENGAGLPENALTGTMTMATVVDLPITVSAAEGRMRLWRNTSLASLRPGTSAELAQHTIGYESDEDVENSFRPAGLIRLSTTVGDTPELLHDYGNTVAPGTTTHHITLYRAASGALVFSAGTIQWSWGLDQTHDGVGPPADPRMQQAQINLFADMGAQPASLDASLVRAVPSTDRTAPSANILKPTAEPCATSTVFWRQPVSKWLRPAAGETVANGSTVTISGTASDVGGEVAGVEVSTDHGASWQPATGTTNWSYSYILQGMGTSPVYARAIDDSGNFTPAGSSCARTNAVGPYTALGPGIPLVADGGDAAGIEAGLRFTPTTDGYVMAVRFYKSPLNSGEHVGSVWDWVGRRLATVTFTDETPSGWQTAVFCPGVPVSAGNSYVVSYTAPRGHYAADADSWADKGLDDGPLLVAGGFDSEPAGVYGAPGEFPTQTFHRTNYFVDAVFDTSDTPPPAEMTLQIGGN